MSHYYRIQQLTLQEISGLQDAIIRGCLMPVFTGIQTLMESNKDCPGIVQELMQKHEALAVAARAVLDAQPNSASFEGKENELVRSMFAAHQVYGFNSVEFQNYYKELAKHLHYNVGELESSLPPPSGSKR